MLFRLFIFKNCFRLFISALNTTHILSNTYHSKSRAGQTSFCCTLLITKEAVSMPNKPYKRFSVKGKPTQKYQHNNYGKIYIMLIIFITIALLFRMILIYDLIYFNNKCIFEYLVNLDKIFLCLF